MQTATEQLRRWHLYPDADMLVRHAAAAIGRIAHEALSTHGDFHLVLAGGSTPIAIYKALRELDTDWSAWHLYWGDERCLPINEAERNSRMAFEAWLDHVPVLASQVHPMPAELGAEAAASAYARLLTEAKRLDLIHLGLGEDGHTASLFPDHDWGEATDAPLVLPVHDSPKPPPDRVSMSARALSQSPQVFMYVTGKGKRDAIRRWRAGDNIPASAIKPAQGIDIWLDEAAWPG
ncbi:6-phosphogluconolactonase [Thermithiobacillus plumbiphilus]|uniref:6-phosphogluconolactonase n=1 Tax=Thermithiobacillus plumbiphilus TaxID=1729899 RepID=A0ABU9D4F6_9PROT